MKTVNSISGGKTSAYIAANYPADYNVFSLVTTSDKSCMFPDAKLRQVVSDRIGKEFIGTLEDDMIIYTLLDLEQFIGQEIKWLSGLTFDEVIKTKGGWLPNKLHRYCSQWLKLIPIFEWWHKNLNTPVEMRIGFRANEMRRAKTMQEKTNANGLLEIKHTISKHKNGKNKWQIWEWQKPKFPLIEDVIFKDQIEKYWSDKTVRFAYMNNCVACFHRSAMLLKHMSNKHPNKFNWFIKQEEGRKPKDTWKEVGNLKYKDILKYKTQIELFDNDFNDCDSGYCGL
jgi:hypothetical protein